MGIPWNPYHPTCKALIGQAKRLVNPPIDPVTEDKPKGLEVEDVKKAVLYALSEIRKERPDFVATSFAILQWQNKKGRTYYDAATDIPPAPPMYEKLAFREWCRNYAMQALTPEQTIAIGLTMVDKK
jgi:hypothetical protein